MSRKIRKPAPVHVKKWRPSAEQLGQSVSRAHEFGDEPIVFDVDLNTVRALTDSEIKQGNWWINNHERIEAEELEAARKAEAEKAAAEEARRKERERMDAAHARRMREAADARKLKSAREALAKMWPVS